MSCKLTILDPTLKYWLKSDKFDSFKEFKTAINQALLEGFIPVGNELKKIKEGSVEVEVNGVNKTLQVKNTNSLIDIVLKGTLDSNNESDHFESFMSSFEDIYNKYKTQEIIPNSEKNTDKDFLETMLGFFEGYPVSDEFKQGETFNNFLGIKDSIRNVREKIEDELEGDEEFDTNESQIKTIEPQEYYEYTLAAFYKPTDDEVLPLNDELSLLKHNVSKEVNRQIKEDGAEFYISFAKDNSNNAQSQGWEDYVNSDKFKQSGFGVVGYLYKVVAGETKRVYIKSHENKFNGKVVLTTDPKEAIKIGQNEVTGFTYTLPDFTSGRYDDVNDDVRAELVQFREDVRATGIESAPFKINGVVEEYPQAHKKNNPYENRKITALTFLQGKSPELLRLATKEEKVVYAGNLYLQMEDSKVPLDRLPLSDAWAKAVYDLLKFELYTPAEAESVTKNLNKLLDFKGGDIRFVNWSNKITAQRKSIITEVDGKKSFKRLENPIDISVDEAFEVLEYARINVHKEWLNEGTVAFPIIFFKNVPTGELRYTNIDVRDFYLKHHATVYRQMNVVGDTVYGPILSPIFDVKTKGKIISEKIGAFQDNPTIGDFQVTPDGEYPLMDVLKELPSIINRMEEGKDTLSLIEALIENPDIKAKLNGKITFSTNPNLKNAATKGQDVHISFGKLIDPNKAGELLAHEVIHLLTSDWILANPNHELVKELDALVAKVPESVLTLLAKQEYGKDHPNFKLEVLARLSDPQVANALKEVGSKKSTLLEKLLGIVRQILEKVFPDLAKVSPSLYTDLLESLVKIATHRDITDTKKKKVPDVLPDNLDDLFGDDYTPLTFGYSAEDLYEMEEKGYSQVFLDKVKQRIDVALTNFIYNKGGLQHLLTGQVGFEEVFEDYYHSLRPRVKYLRDKGNSLELDYYTFVLLNKDFVKDYWINKTGLVKLRKPKKGEKATVEVDTDVTDVTINDTSEVTDREKEEIEQVLAEIHGGGDVIEKVADFDRSGAEFSSLESADKMAIAFVKIIPKIQRDSNGTVKYNAIPEDDSKDYYIPVGSQFIRFETDEANQLVSNDYTQTWSLMAKQFTNKLSLEEMLDSLDNNPKLVESVPEIYVLKHRLSTDIKTPFQASLNAKIERSFKSAPVQIIVMLQDTNGRLNFIDESSDVTSIGKRKVDSGFLALINSEKFSKYYDRENDLVDIEALIKVGLKLPNLEDAQKVSLSSLLGFGFHPDTLRKNGVKRGEVNDFEDALYNLLTNAEGGKIPTGISEVILKGITGKGDRMIDGLNNFFKAVLEIENSIRPLNVSLMVPNAEGELQNTLFQFNSLLQYRKHYNDAQSIEELNDLIGRTKNDLFEYSLTKKQLFPTTIKDGEEVTERSKVQVKVVNLSGSKKAQKGRASEGELTINLDSSEWLKLNFVSLLDKKSGFIENTRAETASTTYAFTLSTWGKSSDYYVPVLMSEVSSDWKESVMVDGKEDGRKFNIIKDSRIYGIWESYLKGEISRIKKQNLDTPKWGLFTDILNDEEKTQMLEEINPEVLIFALNRFFTAQFQEYDNLFENEMGGLDVIPDKSLKARIENNLDVVKAFVVMNTMILHNEESILFQGDISQTPQYYKRAKGVQSTGTPMSKSESLIKFINKELATNSFGSMLGFPFQIGKNFNSATIADDKKPSAFLSKFKTGFAESRRLYYNALGLKFEEEQLLKDTDTLLEDYKEVNIGDGGSVAHPDFYASILELAGNFSEDQRKVHQALMLDARKDAKLYFGEEFVKGINSVLTKEEEAKLKEGFDLMLEGKGQLPLVKFTIRDTMSNTDSVVVPEIMDKFAIFPLYPQFIHDKEVARELFKSMLKEQIGYIKFKSGTKIDTTPPLDIIKMIEDGRVDISFGESKHELQLEYLREQIKTPEKHKKSSTFGTQVRKNVLAELGHVKLQNEKNKGDTKRKWEGLIQQFSLATEKEVLGRLGIKAIGEKWDFTSIDKVKVAEILLEEAETKDLPINIRTYFDEYRKNKINNLENAYEYFESSMGSQQIQSLLASIIKKISVQKLNGTQFRQIPVSMFSKKIMSNGKTRDLGFYVLENGKVIPAECKIGMGGDFVNLLNLQDVEDYLSLNKLEDTTMNRLRALNKKLEDESWVEAHKDVLTIASYRIPNQGHNSDEVMVIREFLPPMHAGEIVLPPEVTTQSGTDYDYDKMSAIVPKIDSQGRYIDYKNLTKEYQDLTYENFLALKEEKRKDIFLLREEKSFVLNKLFAQLKDFKGQKDKQKEYKAIYDKFIEFQVYEINYEISEREGIIAELRQESSVDTNLVNHTRDQIRRLVEYRRNLINARKENRLEYENFKQSFELQKQEVKQEQWEVSFNYSDSLRDKYDDLTKLNTSFYNKKDAIQNEMIKTFADILLDPVNYHKLIVPNSNAIVFDLLKNDLLPKLYKGYDPNAKLRPTEIVTIKRNLRQFKAVKGKDLLGIAAVWNPFTTILQNHNIEIQNFYTKKIGFGPKAKSVQVDVVPKLGNKKVSLFTMDGTNKLEIISQLVNVTVDMPSDDTFGMSALRQDDFGAFIYSISALSYNFKDAMYLFHQPIVLDFKIKVSNKVKSGTKRYKAVTEVLYELFGIPIEKKEDAIDYTKSENQLYSKILGEYEESLNPELLFEDVKPIGEKYEITEQQKAVLAHYIKLLDQASHLRVAQQALNFDTSPDNNLAKARQRKENYKDSVASGIIHKDKINEVMLNSVISGLYVSDIFESLITEMFPVLYSEENKTMFTQLAGNYKQNQEIAFRKAASDFLLSIVQNYGKVNGLNITDVVSPFIEGKYKTLLMKGASDTIEKLKKEGKNYRLLNILTLSVSKNTNKVNPQLTLGLENNSDDKNILTEEFRDLLKSEDPKIKSFAEHLAIIGFIQSGWSKSPLYFSDLIPKEFITPIINESIKAYEGLDKTEKKGFLSAFFENFDYYEGISLGRSKRERHTDSYRLMDWRRGVAEKIADFKKEDAKKNLKESKDEYLDYVETLNKNKTSDTYQYFGATYNIILENGKGIDVEGYQGKNKNKQKLLEAYNTNPNVDPQSGKVFRTTPVEKPTQSAQKNFYEFSDGFKVETDFALNEEQKEALKDLEDFVKGKSKTIALSGAAGTGKTTVVSIFDKWLKNKKYIYPKYSAPTHRANAVTKLMNPSANVFTLHSLFGLTPDIEFEESNFDVKELEFAQKNKPKIEKGDVLIIDESSMISDSLFDFLESAQTIHNVRIIYVGDYAQLKPVKQKEKSKVFTGSHKVSNLVKVERTGENAILAESVNIREGKDWSYQTSLNSKREGVEYISTREQMFEIADKLFLEQSVSENKMKFRILSATNKAVTEVNQMIRKVLYKENGEKQLVKGELLMGYDNFDYNYKTGQFKLYNGGDYEVKEISPSTKTVESIGETFTGFSVLLQNVFDSKELPVSIFVADINEDDSKAIKLADEIQKLQKAGQKAMSVGMGQEAAFYFAEANALKSKVAFMKDITKFDSADRKPKVVIRKTFDYGYAHTIHKAQGGTYENVMILADTLAPFDKNSQQELKYVAVSRAKKIAYIRTNHELNPPLVQDNTQFKFKGYKGGYSNEGKGTPEGDGKDKAMREIAKFFIGEMTDGNTKSSTFGSLMKIKRNPSSVIIRSDKGGIYSLYDAQEGKVEADKYVSINNVLDDPSNKKGVVMLAKNGSAPKQLLQYTKDLILEFHKDGAEFIVGDMPEVDSQFIDYLKEIGATFTIYHGGIKSRITIEKSQDNTQEQLVFTKGTKGIGKEISSYQYGLEYALTNPVFTSPTGTEWKRDWTEGQSKWREYMINGIDFEGKPYKDVEEAYQKNKDKYPIGQERDDFMQSLLEIKLRTYPKLIEGIDAKGGVNYLTDSTHQPTKKNSHWETGGNNAFIELLTKAYLSVKGIQGQTKVDKSLSWGVLKDLPVYSDKGVMVMRKQGNEHFGNPFTGSGVEGLIQMPNIASAVMAYKDWLLTDKYSNIEDVSLLADINNGKSVSVKYEKYKTSFQATVIGTEMVVSPTISYNDNTGETQQLDNGVFNIKLKTNTGKEITAQLYEITGLTTSVNPEQRQWILSQIEQGKLDNKTLLYMKDKGEYYSHADALAEIVNERKQDDTKSNSILKFEKLPPNSVTLGRYEIRDNKAPNSLQYDGRVAPSNMSGSSIGEILQSADTPRIKSYRIANYLLDTLYVSKGWQNSIVQDLANRGVVVKTHLLADDSESPGIMSQQGDIITINVRAIEREIENYGTAGFDNFLTDSLDEEIIHLLTVKLASEEDISNIAKELSKEDRQKVTDYYFSKTNDPDETLRDRSIAMEYVRMVVQQKLFGRTTEDSKQVILGLVPTIKKLLNEVLDYLINLFEKNPQSVSTKVINSLIDVIKNESLNDYTIRLEDVKRKANSVIGYGKDDAVKQVFNEYPELEAIGTVQQYSNYLNTIFPNSKVKDIVYHGTTENFEQFDFNKGKDAISKMGIMAGSLQAAQRASMTSTSEQLKQFQDWEDKGLYPKGFANEMKNKAGFIKPLLFNLKNPFVALDFDTLVNKTKSDFKNNDGFIITPINETTKNYLDTGLEYLVFEPEQIHILSSKSDIQGFKDFMAFENSEFSKYGTYQQFRDFITNKSSTEIENKLIETGKIDRAC